MRGETGSAHSRCVHYRNFNPLPSHEGRRIPVRSAGLSPSNFNPLPSYEGRLPQPMPPQPQNIFQSTPLTRGETVHLIGARPFFMHFNPLPSCEGRLTGDFCPTLFRYFNPLPSCKGRLVGDVEHAHRVAISIHSPHTRGDLP